MKFKLSNASSRILGGSLEPYIKHGFQESLNTFFDQKNIFSVSEPKDPTEINTLEDLENLATDFGERLVVDFENKTITIYDDYLE